MFRSFYSFVRTYWVHGLVGFALAVVLLYGEEDWRGAHAWAVEKAAWEAKGESFDRTKFVPAPVPDDQNIAALPLFKQETVPISKDGPSFPLDVTLRHAMRDDLSRLEFPKFVNPLTGELPDMAALRKTMGSNFALASKGEKPPDDLLVQFGAIYPFFSSFISAAQTRPFLRLDGDYLMPLPAARPLGPLVDLIKLAQILTLHAVIAEDQHRSDLALMDIQTNLKIARGACQDPSMVGGLVAIGIVAINRPAIYKGLALHEWSDAQLAELNSSLKSFDFLADFRFVMRAEAANGITMMDFIGHTNQGELERTLGRGVVRESPVIELVGYQWPGGWWDHNKKVVAFFDLGGLISVDPTAHLAFPRTSEQLNYRHLQAEAAWSGWAPWNILALISTGALTSSMPKFAEGQVSVDEARIACALERYRLAHGVYPATLAELTPTYLDEVPHDIMNGEPYHCRLNADGTFLLYSVGWNQKDDGGAVVMMVGSPKMIDYKNGDWVWPTPKY